MLPRFLLNPVIINRFLIGYWRFSGELFTHLLVQMFFQCGIKYLYSSDPCKNDGAICSE
jgi:hypothetical protein